MRRQIIDTRGQQCHQCGNYYSSHEMVPDTNLCRRCEKDAQKRRLNARRYSRSSQRFDQRLRRTYGITIEDYNRMWEKQSGVCAICHRPPPLRKNRNGEILQQRLYVDHDHTLGTVRGLLCSSCNTLLGVARDDPKLLERAAAYLALITDASGSARN